MKREWSGEMREQSPRIPFNSCSLHHALKTDERESGAASDLRQQACIDFEQDEEGGFMTKGQWLLLGAIAVGLAVGIYLLFFCPTECH